MTTILVAGLVGAFLMAVLFIVVMRQSMVTRIKLDAPFEKVCESMEEAIKSVPGWGHPIPDWDFHKAVSKTHYFDNLSKKRIFFICKAEYANGIVDKFHHMGAMMPCTWAVYETRGGEVYLSKLNIGLMSKMFFGNIIGKNMGKVASEEHTMIKELHRLIAA